jgi:putative acetyltransferase
MVKIRAEISSDVHEIREITELAFKEMPFSEGDEPNVIERLREAGALSLSLVAIREGRVLGHVAFSPVKLESGGNFWFALGPVSVTPKFQNQGIGSKLIRTGLDQLEATGAIGCILTGNPDYYRRFGFQLAPKLCPDREPAEYFQIKQFTEKSIHEKFAFHEAFYGAA